MFYFGIKEIMKKSDKFGFSFGTKEGLYNSLPTKKIRSG
jgi:hypothetical protein